MGVVELHGPVVGEVLHRDAPLVEAAQHVLQAAAHKEVLLLESQTPAFVGAVVGIKHLGDRFRADLFFHRPVVIADVEGMEIEGFGRIGAPEPQPITGVHPIAQHGHIMGNADGLFIGNPTHPMVVLVIEIGFGAAAKANKNRLIRLGNFPGPAAFQPFIGDFDLAAIANQLVEDAEFIADAVPRGGNLQGGEGFEIAGRQPAQAAVAQARFLFHIEDLIEAVDAIALQGLFCRLLDAKHQQVVAQLGTDQELGRQIGHHPLGGGVDRFDPR